MESLDAWTERMLCYGSGDSYDPADLKHFLRVNPWLVGPFHDYLFRDGPLP